MQNGTALTLPPPSCKKSSFRTAQGAPPRPDTKASAGAPARPQCQRRTPFPRPDDPETCQPRRFVPQFSRVGTGSRVYDTHPSLRCPALLLRDLPADPARAFAAPGQGSCRNACPAGLAVPSVCPFPVRFAQLAGDALLCAGGLQCGLHRHDRHFRPLAAARRPAAGAPACAQTDVPAQHALFAGQAGRCPGRSGADRGRLRL